MINKSGIHLNKKEQEMLCTTRGGHEFISSQCVYRDTADVHTAICW